MIALVKQMDSKPTDHLTEFKQTTYDVICLTKSLSLSVYCKDLTHFSSVQ